MTTRAASEIVIGPVITERTYQLYTQGRYTFKVAATASKTEIKKALEEQYESQSIQVKKINTVHMRGKTRRSFRRVGSGTVGNGCGLELGWFLEHGDTVELEVEKIGVLKNRVERQDR